MKLLQEINLKIEFNMALSFLESIEFISEVSSRQIQMKFYFLIQEEELSQ